MQILKFHSNVDTFEFVVINEECRPKARWRFVSGQIPLSANHIFLCVVDTRPASCRVRVAILLIISGHRPAQSRIIARDRVSSAKDVVILRIPNSTAVVPEKRVTLAAYNHD